MKIKLKTKEISNIPEDIEHEPVNNDFTDDLDIAKFLASVHSRVKDEIKEDFVLGTFDVKTKEFIVEMVSNAYFSKFIFKPLRVKLAMTDNDWRKRGIKKEHYIYSEINKKLKLIETEEQIAFDNFMNKLYMIALVNRNVSSNFILKILSGFNQQEEEQNNISNEEVKNSIFSLLKNQEGGQN